MGTPDLSQGELTGLLSGSTDLGVDGAQLCIDLLDGSTKQMVRRKGWFRVPRLQQAAESFTRNHKLFQKATASIEAGVGRTMARPAHSEILAFEEEMEDHVAR